MSAKLKDIVGIVDNLVILEMPAFETLVEDLSGQYVINKVVQLRLTDYGDDKTVTILKISKED